jgi:hypothetical protein
MRHTSLSHGQGAQSRAGGGSEGSRLFYESVCAASHVSTDAYARLALTASVACVSETQRAQLAMSAKNCIADPQVSEEDRTGAGGMS